MNQTPEDLTEYLKKHPATGNFSPIPHYFPDGDFINLYICEDRCYSERINEWLTIYRSFDTDELVGCKIKGVRLLLVKLINLLTMFTKKKKE